MSATGIPATRGLTINTPEYVARLEYQGTGQAPVYSTVGITSTDRISVSYRDPDESKRGPPSR